MKPTSPIRKDRVLSDWIDPVGKDGIIVHLYSDDGSVEFIVFEREYQNSAGVTQPEINRIVQSLRKAPQEGATAA